MSNDLNDSIDSALKLSESSTTAIWKLILEVYKIEVNKSILGCDIVYGTFQKYLQVVKMNLNKGYNILSDIFFELKTIEKGLQNNDIDIVQLAEHLAKFQEILGSPQQQQNSQENLESRAEQCSDMIDFRLKVLNLRKKEVDRAASLPLTTAGLAFAGFAAVLGASAKALVCNNITSRYFLRASSGGFLLASVAQLAEYIDYDRSFDRIVDDFSVLRESLTNLLEDVDKFNVELLDVIQQVRYYSRDGETLIRCPPDSESFSSKVSELATKTKDLQITLVKLETNIDLGTDFAKAGRSELPKKYRVKKRVVINLPL